MKRKNKFLLSFFIVFALVFFTAGHIKEVQAKEGVTYTMNQGVLTIRGNGKMPKKMTFSDNHEIREVVIKNGVTSISDYAFYNCENLRHVKLPKTLTEIGIKSFYRTGIKEIVIPSKVKVIGQYAFIDSSLKKLTMPGKVRIKYEKGDDGRSDVIANKLESVKFNTDFALATAVSVSSKKLIVKKGDSNYRSIGGVVYTKDGKQIVRVPSRMRKLTVASGCEVFNTQSVTYASDDGEDVQSCCTGLTKIIMPDTVKSICSENYFSGVSAPIRPVEIKVNAGRLEQSGIENLYHMFRGAYYVSNEVIERYAAYHPEEIVKEDDMYYSRDGIFIRYLGTDKEITIPDFIVEIADSCFAKNPYIETVTIPDTVNIIQDKAFDKCVNLKRVIVSKKIGMIGKNAFSNAVVTSDDIRKMKVNIKKNQISGRKRQLILQWKRVRGASGTEIIIAKDKNFKKRIRPKNIRVKKSTCKYSMDKQYKHIYMKVMSYKKVNGTKIYVGFGSVKIK